MALVDTDAEQTVISEIIGSLGISSVRFVVKDDRSGSTLETIARNPKFLVYLSPAGRERSTILRPDLRRCCELQPTFELDNVGDGIDIATLSRHRDCSLDTWPDVYDVSVVRDVCGVYNVNDVYRSKCSSVRPSAVDNGYAEPSCVLIIYTKRLYIYVCMGTARARSLSIHYSAVSLTVEIRAQLLRVCISYHVNISSGSRCIPSYEMARAIGCYDWMPTY